MGHWFLYVEHTHTFSSKPSTRVFAAIPGGSVGGPVIEVQIAKILDQYGLEIAQPSPRNH